jgi:hypothetical protein
MTVYRCSCESAVIRFLPENLTDYAFSVEVDWAAVALSLALGILLLFLVIPDAPKDRARDWPTTVNAS